MIVEVPIALPRHAFSPRNAARAGDVWRAFQEVATAGSTACGWPPSRYRQQRIGFIVREMTAVHVRETPHGEAVRARTWVRDFRRGLLSTREIRLEGEAGPIASASQEWVHVRINPDGAEPGEPLLKPVRASQELLDAFGTDDPEPSPALPAFEARSGPEHRFVFRTWHVWMDPFGHANHPAYVDWCDEATSRAMAATGLDPLSLAPVAERVFWKTGVLADQEVTVHTRLSGVTAEGHAVLEHRILTGAALCATATTVRRLADGGTDALLAAMG